MFATDKRDEIGWISAFLDHKAGLHRDDVDSVMYFSLIWNMFEGHCCEQDASVPKLEEVTKRLHRNGVLRQNDFLEVLDYFSKRYVRDGETNSNFDSLYFRRNDRKEFVASVLKGEHTEINDIVLALLIIIFRLRNNLFHGIKKMHSIAGQRNNFIYANQVLIFRRNFYLKQELFLP